MKSAIVLALIGQGLAAAIPAEGTDDYTTRTLITSDAATTRTFAFPPWPPGGSWPTPSPRPDPPTYPPYDKREAEPAEVQEREVFSAGPDPTKVQITGLTYGGTGCPSGSVAYQINEDRTIMTLIFDKYVASIGGGSAVAERRKNCQLGMGLKYPGGFQYSIMSADYRGYAYMDKGVTGTQKSTYYFSGQTAQSSTGTTWKGPFDNTYLIHDEAESASIVWSPCGDNAMLNINSQVQLASTNTTGIGYLSTDSIDTSFIQKIYVQWQPCKAK